MSELISVVVISKNEEDFIGKCIESVLEATKDFDNYEILLVDSASADGTIEIAKI
ncbi:MAG: Glycosyltransferase AglE [Candidatus Methanophagaceae archaeon]|nr:MAG: Glycosyltransferase AglE [Methanophagales archaeon]